MAASTFHVALEHPSFFPHTLVLQVELGARGCVYQTTTQPGDSIAFDSGNEDGFAAWLSDGRVMGVTTWANRSGRGWVVERITRIA